jgi:hypothetical protein
VVRYGTLDRPHAGLTMLHSRSLVHLLALRYRLLWAQTRTRNGRIAVFITLYLFGVMVFALLAMGGLGAALVAVRAGRAEMVARIVLGGFFFNALMASAILGFGMNSVFSEAVLRRFPLSPLDRLVARQLTAIVEPMWVIVLGLYLGLAVGFYGTGVSGLWIGVLAAVALLVANYLLARVLLNLVERLMNSRGGTAVMMVFILSVSFLPSLLLPKLIRNQVFQDAAARVLRFTPPFAAAHVMAGAPGGTAVLDVALILAWSAVLLAVVFWFERTPPAIRAEARGKAEWNSAYDRVAACLGPTYGPIAGKMLRYFLRSNKVRYNYAMAVPLMVFLTYTQSRRGGELSMFVMALSAFALVGFVGTASMAVNQFGYDGGGFRRWFLLPLMPEHVFRASSLVTLLLGGSLLPPCYLLWFAVAPVHTTPARFVMLLSSGLGGLLLFNALALWTSLYTPRRCEFTHTFGNDLSAGGNVLLIGGFVPLLIAPAVLRATHRQQVLLDYWWAFPLFLAAAALFYRYMVSSGAARFAARRERLLAIMEGRN